MELASELRRALAAVCAAGAPEVHENGEWLAGLQGLQYEVSAQGDEAALLHLWSSQQSLVRRVVRLADESRDRVVLEVSRFGYTRNARLEFAVPEIQRDPRRVEREQFSSRLRDMLIRSFPDETVESLATSADLHHSISGSYTRGLVRRGSEAFAVLAASQNEDSATIDGILTFGLIWLQHSRDRAKRYSVNGLRLLVPHRTSRVTAHRMAALASPGEVELYEYEPIYWRLRKVARSNAGNLETWIVPRREIEQAMSAAMPTAERILQLVPGAIQVGVSAAPQEVTLRFRGLEFARWHMGEMWYGLGEQKQVLTPGRWSALETLVRQLETHRHPLASDAKHRLYRSHPERWLETMVSADPARIDARLDPRQIYAQVPACSSADRGIIDLLGITRDGQLAVLELKASEDIQLAMQAVDYWLRVRFHHEQDDFRRYGYFPDAQLNSKPPLLYLVAPGFRFHPSMEVVLRYLSPEIEIARVALAENWRRGLKVIFRQ